LTLSADIFVSGETYEIKKAGFTVPVNGYYYISGAVMFTNTIALKRYGVRIYKRGVVELVNNFSHSGLAANLSVVVNDQTYLVAGDIIELHAIAYAGVSTVDIMSGGQYTFMSIHFLSAA